MIEEGRDEEEQSIINHKYRPSPLKNKRTAGDAIEDHLRRQRQSQLPQMFRPAIPSVHAITQPQPPVRSMPKWLPVIIWIYILFNVGNDLICSSDGIVRPFSCFQR